MSDSPEEFEIRVEFARGIGDPTRVFRTMAGLIESAQRMDTHLAEMIGANVRTSLVLQDVEATSLKSRLRSVIEAIPDEPLQAGDIKKLVGHFLLKGKHKVLDWCEERNEVGGRADIKLLEGELLQLAQESEIKQLPAYAPINTTLLLSDISAVNDALAPLQANDFATFRSPEGSSRYNPQLVVSEGVVQDILTREQLSSRGERLVKVKRPDYLGSSKWGLRYNGHMIEAKIADLGWLERFQNNQERVQPGDSLRVLLSEQVSYGYDNEVVHTEYEVEAVLAVVRSVVADRKLSHF